MREALLPLQLGPVDQAVDIYTLPDVAFWVLVARVMGLPLPEGAIPGADAVGELFLLAWLAAAAGR